MDFAIKPVTESIFQDNYPFYSIADKHIGFNQHINVGAVQVGTPESAKVPYIPEIGKGSIMDVWA